MKKLTIALLALVAISCSPTAPPVLRSGLGAAPITLGPVVCPSPSGGGTANQAQTIDNTVRECGPLPEGHYTLEGDQDMYVNVYSTGHIPASTAAMANSGLRVPANTEIDFEVPGDGYYGANSQVYVSWTRVSASGTNFRCNTRDKILMQ